MPTPFRRFSLVIVHWSLILCLLPGCTADTSPASKPAPAKPAFPTATAPVTFDTTTMTLKGKPFAMEVAQTEAQTARGLMYRDSLPEDHGMLFVMPEEKIWDFWMHETRIPLDIIFLDKSGKVLEIHNRIPMDETGRGPASPNLYVIELNLGMAGKIGLQKGDIVEIPKKYIKN